MSNDFIEELKAKVTANCGMALTPAEAKELLGLLTSPETVAASAPGVEAKKETLPAEDAKIVHPEDFGAKTSVTEEKKGPLPDNFPGRAALAGAGINTFAQARKARDSEEGLTGITGVGDATAKAIKEALN